MKLGHQESIPKRTSKRSSLNMEEIKRNLGPSGKIKEHSNKTLLIYTTLSFSS
jgi:hypothetical protein